MNRPLRSGLWLLAALIVLALLAARFVRTEDDHGGGPPARTSSMPLAVDIRTIEPQRLAEVLSTTGTLYADERIEVVSEIAGKVQQIAFQEGARVQEGALLVQIDDRELRAERERIAARVELANRRRERQEQLYRDGLISEQDRDTAATEAAALAAELSQIEVRLDKTQIRAPFSGVVGLRRVSEGAFVSPQTRVTTLVDADPIKLEFAVPERYAARLRPGDTVDFSVEGVDGSRTATVYAIEPSVDAATRTVPVRARSANASGALLPGAFADVRLPISEVEGALAVPSIAIIPELGGKKVFVVEEGKAQPRQIVTGIRTEDRVEVTRGLEAGDRVITSGLQRLRPGLPVTAAEAEETP